MNSNAHRIAVLASGRGTNAKRLFSHFENHAHIRVELLLSSSPKALVIEHAKRFAIPVRTLTYAQLRDTVELLRLLEAYKITHLVLAGFVWLIPSQIVASYRDCIINIHPSLLPRYGGKGMYGMRVHEAVKKAKEKESGITIHLVDEQYDHGKSLFQTRCQINPTDTPSEIAGKVQQLEHTHYARIIENWLQRS